MKELNEMMTQFVESAKDGSHEEKGFKNTAYGMSKVGLSALPGYSNKNLTRF